VFLGRSLDFAVTPKTKQERTGPAWHLVRPQLVAIGTLLLAVVVGVIRIAVGQANVPGTIFNMLWVAFDLAIFSVIIKAARYGGYDPAEQPDVSARPRRGAA
jgi:cellulose synthase (UDP-forming)